MNADRNTVVLGVPADIPFEIWDEWLNEQGSPLVAVSRLAYNVAVIARVLPSFLLGMYEHESNSGTRGAAVHTLSMGNTRQAYRADGEPLFFGVEPKKNPDGSIVLYENAPGSFFPVFRSLLDGVISTVARLMADNWAYWGRGLRTVAQIVPVWAPSKDGNNVENYIAKVVGVMQTLRGRATAGTGGTKLVRVALLAGHANLSGGNEFEAETTRIITPRTAAVLRSKYGADVRVYTPDGPDADHEPGDGTFPGSLSAAARAVVADAERGWVPHLITELHTEGVGNPATRGCFGIFPNMGGELDADARDKLIPMVVRRMSEYLGIPLRGNGTMAETSTGVGGTGSRLGFFAATYSLRNSTERVIFECGTHTNPIERELMRTERYYNGVAVAIADGVAEYYGVPVALPPIDPDTREPDQEFVFFPETGCTIHGWFRQYWEGVQMDGQPAGLEIFGYPRTNEIVEDGRTVQYFDRAVLTLVDGGTDWTNGVIGRLVGYEDAIRRGYIGG